MCRFRVPCPPPGQTEQWKQDKWSQCKDYTMAVAFITPCWFAWAVWYQGTLCGANGDMSHTNRSPSPQF